MLTPPLVAQSVFCLESRNSLWHILCSFDFPTTTIKSQWIKRETQMKTILMGLTLMLTLNSFAAQTYTLNAEEMNIGKLMQEHEGKSEAKFYIKRTAATPRKVELDFAFDEYYSYCSEYDTEQYWVSSYTTTECHTHNGKEYCEKVHVSGHYDYREVCVAYDYAADADTDELRLDFKKANVLTGSQSETFLVQMKQKSFTSESFDVSITAVKTKTNYEIERKKSFFGGKTLKFKFKAK